MDITRDVMSGVKAGKSPAQIRAAIDGQYGTRNATPTPRPSGK
jgi:hypothetical protein